MPQSSPKRHANYQYMRLQRRYLDIKAKVAEMEGRRALTSQEQLEVVTLKRRKLALKDALNELQD